MSPDNLVFVSFEPKGDKFLAFLSIEGIFSEKRNPQLIIQDAAKLYLNAIGGMRKTVEDITNCRKQGKSPTAQKMWELGDTIFNLVEKLEKFSLQIDNLYFHLERDLVVKRKWLEKIIIFRRYVPQKKLVPLSLKWSQCEHGTRRIAEKLRDHMPIERNGR